MTATPPIPLPADPGDDSIRTAVAEYEAELREAAREGLFGRVHAAAGFQAGRINTHAALIVPTTKR